MGTVYTKTQSTVFIYLIIIQWQLGNNDESHDVLWIDWLTYTFNYFCIYLFMHLNVHICTHFLIDAFIFNAIIMDSSAR